MWLLQARYFREEDIDGTLRHARLSLPVVRNEWNKQFESFVFAEFRECFYLFARSGQIRTLDELTIIMRSLGLSPTIAELNKYMKDKGNGYSTMSSFRQRNFKEKENIFHVIPGGKMSFADFLEVMHLQTRAEDLPKEVIKAFQAADTSHSGTIPARQLAHMLLHWGEQLSSKEGKVNK